MHKLLRLQADLQDCERSLTRLRIRRNTLKSKIRDVKNAITIRNSVPKRKARKMDAMIYEALQKGMFWSGIAKQLNDHGFRNNNNYWQGKSAKTFWEQKPND